MDTATKHEASDFGVKIDLRKTARMHLIKDDIYLLACLPKKFYSYQCWDYTITCKIMLVC